MATVTNIDEVLDGHVGLSVDCVDRLYLNAYLPKLRTAGQVARFLHDHRGFLLPSPAAATIDRVINSYADNTHLQRTG